ncbi:MAG: thioredoxin domain-containing protein, partial [Candidatus Aminicenantaceae bacterium]
VPAKYGIMSIPALLLFKGGEVVETVIGALPQDKIVDAIAKHL